MCRVKNAIRDEMHPVGTKEIQPGFIQQVEKV